MKILMELAMTKTTDVSAMITLSIIKDLSFESNSVYTVSSFDCVTVLNRKKY